MNHGLGKLIVATLGVMLIVMSVTVEAQATAAGSGSEVGRQFRLTAAPKGHQTLIIVDRKQRKLLACDYDNPTDCMFIAADVHDALPVPDNASKWQNVLIQRSNGTFAICRFGNSRLDEIQCDTDGARQLFDSLVSSGRTLRTLKVGDDEIDCAIGIDGIICTKVRELREVPRVLVGSFSTSGRLEAIVRDGNRTVVCEVGVVGSCRSALGLPELLNFSAAASTQLGSTGRSSILLVGNASVTTCAASGQLSELLFSCDQRFVRPDVLANMRTIILPTKSGREVVQFNMKKGKKAGTDIIQSTALVASGNDPNGKRAAGIQTGDQTDLVEHDEPMYYSTSQLSYLQKLSRDVSLTPIERRGSQAPSLAKTFYDSSGEFSSLQVPDLFIVGADGFGDLVSQWSDILGLYFWYEYGRREGETQQQCIQRECDTQLQQDNQMCNNVTDVVGISLGTVVVAGAIWAGVVTRSFRVGGAAASMGTSSAGNLLFGAVTACQAYRWQAYHQCSYQCR